MVAKSRSRAFDHARRPTTRSRNGNSRRPSSNASWAPLQKAWRALGTRLPELRSDLSCLAAVQVDRARLAFTRVVAGVVRSFFVTIAIAGILATAASLLVVGIAGGIAAALDGKVWLAQVITGAGVLVLIAAAIAISARVQAGRRLRRLARRYERYDARQQSMEREQSTAREQQGGGNAARG
jgi:hypothetical protein